MFVRPIKSKLFTKTMTKLETQLKNKIMRRVYAVWMLKKVLSFAFLRFLVLCGLAFELFREVSVVNVLNNLPNVTDIAANFRYISFAFAHTEASVQLYVFGITAMVLWYTAHKLVISIPNISVTGSRI